MKHENLSKRWHDSDELVIGSGECRWRNLEVLLTSAQTLEPPKRWKGVGLYSQTNGKLPYLSRRNW